MNDNKEQLLSTITAILRRGLAPRKIILFGSHARGNTSSGSDVDILLVMDNGTNRRKTAVDAYRLLGSIGIAKDIIVVTEDDVKNFGLLPGTFLQPALAEGKVLYEKAA